MFQEETHHPEFCIVMRDGSYELGVEKDTIFNTLASRKWIPRH